MINKREMGVNYDDLDIEFDKNGVHEHYYNGKLFTGIAFEFDKNGIIISESSYKNGIDHGVSKIWFEGGKQLRSETNYHTSYKHGESREWYEGGKLKKESLYEIGTLIRSKGYNEEGDVISEYNIEVDSPKTLEGLNDWKEILRMKGINYD